MTGPNPKPAPQPAPRANRRRVVKPAAPWPLVSGLFLIYLLAGLLLSAPAPPFWTWIIIAIAIPLLTVGLTHPLALDQPPKRTGLTTYLGGFLLAIALSIALNYIGSEQSFDETGFFVAVLTLGVLTLLAVGLCIAAAIFSTLAGERLLQTRTYPSSLSVLLGTAFGGICAGGIIGLLALTTVTSA